MRLEAEREEWVKQRKKNLRTSILASVFGFDLIIFSLIALMRSEGSNTFPNLLPAFSAMLLLVLAMLFGYAVIKLTYGGWGSRSKYRHKRKGTPR